MMKKKRNRLGRFLLILLLTAIFIVGVIVIGNMIYDRLFQPAVPTDDGLDYHGHKLPVSENLDTNDLDPSLFYKENGKIYYDGDDVKYGIDVSSHQKEIDWNAVAKSGVDFAIIRVGYRGYGSAGSINPDEYFEANINGALENGIKVGVYFFSQAITEEEAREEAEFTLDMISGYDITYPVIFDWEHIVNVESARTYYYQDFDVSSFANAFCDVIIKAGFSTTVYFNPSAGYLIYDVDSISDHTFWLAEYDDVPSFYYKFIIWQYTNKGTVPGIEGSVDLNISFINHYDTEKEAVQDS